MYRMINLDYDKDSLAPNISNNNFINHYDYIYYNNLEILNKLLNSANYNYSDIPRKLINNISIFNLSIRGEILYYLSSFLNHNLYFYNISNKKNTSPLGKLNDDIVTEYGSYNNFKEEFIKSANNLKGSGYTFLVKDNSKLKIINTSNEDSPYYYGFIPIICLDLWEHAYYLDYGYKREEYINNFFKIIDFVKINNYYESIINNKRKNK